MRGDARGDAGPGDVQLHTETSKPKIHLQSIEDIFKELNPAGERGFSSSRAKELFEIHGPNELEKPPRVSLLVLFIIQLNSVIMYLLMAAVVASAVIRATGPERGKVLSYIDSIAISIIVLINATIAAVTENSANDALEALSSLQSPISVVIRDGQEVEVNSRDIVPGDIVKLKTGDVVPADIRNIHTSDFRVNEMLLTGEPEDVAKNTVVKQPISGHPEKLTADNMAFSSCNVKAGTCVGVVVATGMKTRVGSIAALLNQDGEEKVVGPVDPDAMEKGGTQTNKKKKTNSCLPDTKAGQSPLQVSLEALAIKIGYMAIAVCLVVFIVGAAMGTKDPESPDTPSWFFHGPRCRDPHRGGHSRGAASVRDHRSVIGLLSNGEGERADAQNRSRGNAGFCLHHLHRQDWHSHRGQDDACCYACGQHRLYCDGHGFRPHHRQDHHHHWWGGCQLGRWRCGHPGLGRAVL
jgi:magnesium-transporting ATPase (P-type)